jgi:hypothetical protein
MSETLKKTKTSRRTHGLTIFCTLNTSMKSASVLQFCWIKCVLHSPLVNNECYTITFFQCNLKIQQDEWILMSYCEESVNFCEESKPILWGVLTILLAVQLLLRRPSTLVTSPSDIVSSPSNIVRSPSNIMSSPCVVKGLVHCGASVRPPVICPLDFQVTNWPRWINSGVPTSCEESI